MKPDNDQPDSINNIHVAIALQGKLLRNRFRIYFYY